MADSIDRNMIELREQQEETRHWITWDFLHPRIWKLMLLAALPLLMVTEPAFERLEQSGAAGLFLATPLFSALMVGYAVLLLVLKKRNL